MILNLYASKRSIYTYEDSNHNNNISTGAATSEFSENVITTVFNKLKTGKWAEVTEFNTTRLYPPLGLIDVAGGPNIMAGIQTFYIFTKLNTTIQPLDELRKMEWVRFYIKSELYQGEVDQWYMDRWPDLFTGSSMMILPFYDNTGIDSEGKTVDLSTITTEFIDNKLNTFTTGLDINDFTSEIFHVGGLNDSSIEQFKLPIMLLEVGYGVGEVEVGEMKPRPLTRQYPTYSPLIDMNTLFVSLPDNDRSVEAFQFKLLNCIRVIRLNATFDAVYDTNGFGLWATFSWVYTNRVDDDEKWYLSFIHNSVTYYFLVPESKYSNDEKNALIDKTKHPGSQYKLINN